MRGYPFHSRLVSVVCTLLCLMAVSGCAISKQESGITFAWKKPKWSNPFASASARKEAVSEKEQAESGTHQKTRTVSAENPFQEKESSTKIRLASANQISDRKQEISDGLPSGLDPATLMLIQTEFEDVPAEERKKWYEELRQVPPSMIPQILRMRRLAQKAARESSLTGQSSTRERTSLKLTSNSQQQRFESEPAPTDQTPWSDRDPSRRELKLGESRRQPWDSPVPGGSPGHQIDVAQKQKSVVPSPLDSPETMLLESLINPQNGEQDFQKALDQFIAIAERRVASLQPGDTEKQKQEFIAGHAYLRMLYLMANRQERALEAIPDIPPADQEFWQQMFWALSNYFDTEGIPNASDRATHTISQLGEAIERLRQRANLELRNVLFCTKIDGFGTYDRFERSEFSPGQPVLIYAEVRNFLSSPTANGQYKTILKSTIEIHRAGSQGGMISKQEFPPTEDLCRNRRTDYFHSYLLNMPKDLPAGPYVLKLIVEDQVNHKVASYLVNFSII